jgi:hypothetical protein
MARMGVSLVVIEKSTYFVLQVFRLPAFAFPNNQLPPALSVQHRTIALVSIAVALQLRSPEILPGFWHSRQFAIRIGMTMPETSVDKDDFLPAAKHKVGATG